MTSTVTATATGLKPLGDRLVVRPTPREETTKSGIVLPDTAKERPQEGTILSVGPGRQAQLDRRGVPQRPGLPRAARVRAR